MSHIWVRDQENEWAILRLDCDALALDHSPPRPLPAEEAVASARAGDRAILIRLSGRRDAGDDRRWALLASGRSRVRINGLPPIAGLRILDDRDEIAVTGPGTIYFSTERQARVEPFPGGDEPAHCPRCKLAMEAGSPAIRCPRCDTWHHQSSVYPCYTYTDSCALCDQPTAVDAGFRFTPEDL